MKKMFVAALFVLAPAPAFAYIGPGAGLGLLGALWGLIAAIVVALVFVIAWPVRKLFRRPRVGDAQPDNSHTRTNSPEHPVTGQGGS